MIFKLLSFISVKSPWCDIHVVFFYFCENQNPPWCDVPVISVKKAKLPWPIGVTFLLFSVISEKKRKIFFGVMFILFYFFLSVIKQNRP